MPTVDPAKIIKDALPVQFAATLHVDDDWTPTIGVPVVLLVANDGGPAIRTGQWPWQEQPQGYAAPFRRRSIRRPLIRMTAFAKGRTEAREAVDGAVDWIIDNRPAEISRIEDASDPLITRDRATGAYLASVTMPVITRPITA